MLGHPGVPGVLVSLLLRTKGDETWQGVWRAGAEPSRCRATIRETGTGHEDGQEHAQPLDQQLPLAPVARLAAIIPTLGPPLSGVLPDGLSRQMALGVGSRPGRSAWRMGASVPRAPIARPSDQKDRSCSAVFYEP